MRTTVYIREDYSRRLKELCELKRMKSGSLAVDLIRNFAWKKIRKQWTFLNRPVLYQERANKGKRLHLNLTPIEYDLFLDCRKILRLSVSHILAIAIDLYDELTNVKKNIDSYPCSSYTKIKSTIDGLLLYAFCYGIPGKQTKISIPP